MKAIIYTSYGPPEVLQLQEVEKPVPGDNEVLIRTVASTVTMGDCEMRALTSPLWLRIPLRFFLGYRKPKAFGPGMELSGVIESVGKNVSLFKEGDAVFGSTGMRMRGNAEYKCRPAANLAIKPPGLGFEEAATISVGGINALQFLRRANIKPGQTVLIIGGGGCIGTYGVLLAKLYGAEVTAVDNSAKLEMLRSIGADHVIDYTREHFSARGVKYDVIFDLIYGSSFSTCLNSLKSNGTYLMANGGPRRMLFSLWVEWTSRKKVIFQPAAETGEDLRYLGELIASGKIRPVIDKTYPLEKTSEAHAYVESGNKKGCVVIKVIN